MAPAAQAIRNQEILKTENSEKAAIGALYDELSQGIESLKKGDVNMRKIFQENKEDNQGTGFLSKRL